MDTKELIFNIYKEEVLISKKFKAEIIKRFKVTQREAGDLFAKIQNYQIKKHGKNLTREYVDVYSKECLQKKHRIARQRKYDKLRCFTRQREMYEESKKGEL